MAPQIRLSPFISLLSTPNHSQVQDDSSSILLNASPSTGLTESSKDKNLNYAGSKDVYMDNIFGIIKEKGFSENLLKEVHRDVRSLIKTEIKPIQNQPSSENSNSNIY